MHVRVLQSSLGQLKHLVVLCTNDDGDDMISFLIEKSTNIRTRALCKSRMVLGLL